MALSFSPFQTTTTGLIETTDSNSFSSLELSSAINLKRSRNRPEKQPVLAIKSMQFEKKSANPIANKTKTTLWAFCSSALFSLLFLRVHLLTFPDCVAGGHSAFLTESSSASTTNFKVIAVQISQTIRSPDAIHS